MLSVFRVRRILSALTISLMASVATTSFANDWSDADTPYEDEDSDYEDDDDDHYDDEDDDDHGEDDEDEDDDDHGEDDEDEDDDDHGEDDDDEDDDDHGEDDDDDDDGRDDEDDQDPPPDPEPREEPVPTEPQSVPTTTTPIVSSESDKACTTGLGFLDHYYFSTNTVAMVSSANQIRIEVVCDNRSLLEPTPGLVSRHNTDGLIGAISRNDAMSAELRQEHFTADEVVGIMIYEGYDTVLYVYPR